MSNMRITTQTLDLRTLGGMFGRCNIVADGAGNVIPGSTGTVWRDQLGTNPTSNIIGGVTIADASNFSGRIAQGEVWTIFGFQVQIGEVTAGDLPVNTAAQIHQNIIDSLQMTLFLQGQEYIIGSPKTMPCGLGSNGLAMNGGRAVAPFRFPAELPIQVSSNDTWSATFTVRQQVALTAANNKIEIFVYCPASKGIPIAQLSGA